MENSYKTYDFELTHLCSPTLDSSTTLTARLSSITLKKSFKPNLMKSQLSISIINANRLIDHEQKMPTSTASTLDFDY
ncbi:unnamed protein product [Adineta steineri]|uniref:Uncharacterized protein n=1 Tax=Adineta steineri TaxID=433720 RepID=A0A813U8J4_9BILA|nr:unnamed protein product [Adineta steineri]